MRAPLGRSEVLLPTLRVSHDLPAVWAGSPALQVQVTSMPFCRPLR